MQNTDQKRVEVAVITNADAFWDEAARVLMQREQAAQQFEELKKTARDMFGTSADDFEARAATRALAHIPFKAAQANAKGLQSAHPPFAKGSWTFTVDGKAFGWSSQMILGRALRALANVPANRDLWRTAPSPYTSDDLMHDDMVVSLGEAVHFYTAPREINGA